MSWPELSEEMRKLQVETDKKVMEQLLEPPPDGGKTITLAPVGPMPPWIGQVVGAFVDGEPFPAKGAKAVKGFIDKLNSYERKIECLRMTPLQQRASLSVVWRLDSGEMIQAPPIQRIDREGVSCIKLHTVAIKVVVPMCITDAFLVENHGRLISQAPFKFNPAEHDPPILVFAYKLDM